MGGKVLNVIDCRAWLMVLAMENDWSTRWRGVVSGAVAGLVGFDLDDRSGRSAGLDRQRVAGDRCIGAALDEAETDRQVGTGGEALNVTVPEPVL